MGDDKPSLVMELWRDVCEFVRGGSVRQAVDRRTVYANNPELNKSNRLADNHVKTSRYNVVTFLPLNLIEQLRQASNIYFIVITVIQILGYVHFID